MSIKNTYLCFSIQSDSSRLYVDIDSAALSIDWRSFDGGFLVMGEENEQQLTEELEQVVQKWATIHVKQQERRQNTTSKDSMSTLKHPKWPIHISN